MPGSRPSARFVRRGFSLIEIMLVVVIVGVLAVTTVPKISQARDQYSVIAARQRVAAAVATARAAAIHGGRESLFIVSGQYISVWTKNPTTGFWQQRIPYQSIGEAHDNVQVEIGGSGWHYIWFEPRGLTLYRPPSTTVYRLVGKAKSDSVCVTRLGQILPENCQI
jgi:prepilin-type N-terminal cleavage/methylation domain-containing protein